MHKFVRLAAVALGLLLLASCAPTQPRQVIVGNSGDVVELGVMDMLRVTDIREQRQNSFLKLQFTVNNDSKGVQQFIYRVEWQDENRFTLGAEEAWKPEVVTGMGIKHMQSIAPHPNARYYRIYITSPDNKELPERPSRFYRPN